MAAVRLTSRLADRVLKAHGHENVDRGVRTKNDLVDNVGDDWTSLVVQLHDGGASPESRISANFSAFVPRNVDFGPFQVGSLSASAFHPPKSPGRALGISLPMGVKVSVRSDSGQPWSPLEDEALRRFSERFGNNWHLVARALAIFERSHMQPRIRIPGKSTIARTASQCGERMKLLTSTKVARSSATGRKETDLRKPEHQRISRTRNAAGDGQTPHQALLVVKDRLSPVQRSSAGKRNFSAFRAASSKKQDIPMAIPGGVAGQEPTMAPPHMSHHQALQAAVAAMSSGGRAEMWPLQILDLGDKQRAKARPAGRSAVGSWSHAYSQPHSPRRISSASRPAASPAQNPHRPAAPPGK